MSNMGIFIQNLMLNASDTHEIYVQQSFSSHIFLNSAIQNSVYLILRLYNELFLDLSCILDGSKIRSTGEPSI